MPRPHTKFLIVPLEAINGNVQAAKRKAKGYRTKRNLKAVIAGDVLANSPT